MKIKIGQLEELEKLTVEQVAAKKAWAILETNVLFHKKSIIRIYPFNI